jgi:predicted acetyltransferase
MKPLTDPGRLADGKIYLKLKEISKANSHKWYVPAYTFDIRRLDETAVGSINLRIGYTNDLVWYCGHIGYGVHEAQRGHHFAGKACRLLLPLAAAHSLDVIWITCNPDNWPSRKTCENLGAQLVEIVDLPETSDMYAKGEQQKCRYRLILK